MVAHDSKAQLEVRTRADALTRPLIEETTQRHLALQEQHAHGGRCSSCCGEPNHAGCEKCKPTEPPVVSGVL